MVLLACRIRGDVAFSYEMLRDYSNRFPNRPIPFSTFFKERLSSYVGVDLAFLKQRYQNHAKLFQAAVLDFWNLQKLPYHMGFTCPNGAKQVIVDGISLGLKKERCCLVYPWEPAKLAEGR
jgi:hypothetical protein